MTGRYSKFLRPISILSHLLILNVTFYILEKDSYSNYTYIFFINFCWLILSYYVGIYYIYRFTKFTKVASLLASHFILYTLAYFAFFGLFNIGVDISHHVISLLIIFTLVVLFNAVFMTALKFYRLEGGNFRRVVTIGNNKNVRDLEKFFKDQPEFGYRFIGNFSDKNDSKGHYLGNIDDCSEYILKNNIDELYCSTADLNQTGLKKLIHFSENNFKVIKMLPNVKDIYTKNTLLEYYDNIPVIPLRKLPFDSLFNKYFKRLFDIVFSIFIIVFLLSWVIPILFILIKIESKGPLFFKQERSGLNGVSFECYKFRSMKINSYSNKLTTIKDDVRITKTGKFIRKTSIDELPQFFNVLFGDMTVVGPRPHMINQTEKYSKIVNKYMVRQFVKPGITGLAQVKGYRGEIEIKKDMEDRVKWDIFYIENWTIFLDIKIIIQTIINTIKGEEKAY